MWGSFVIDFSQNTQRLNQVLFWKQLHLFVGKKAKGRISKKQWLQENKARKISRKLTFLTPVSFRKTFRALFFCIHRFEIRPLALLSTYWSRNWQNYIILSF